MKDGNKETTAGITVSAVSSGQIQWGLITAKYCNVWYWNTS